MVTSSMNYGILMMAFNNSQNSEPPLHVTLKGKRKHSAVTLSNNTNSSHSMATLSTLSLRGLIEKQADGG